MMMMIIDNVGVCFFVSPVRSVYLCGVGVVVGVKCEDRIPFDGIPVLELCTRVLEYVFRGGCSFWKQ